MSRFVIYLHYIITTVSNLQNRSAYPWCNACRDEILAANVGSGAKPHAEYLTGHRRAIIQRKGRIRKGFLKKIQSFQVKFVSTLSRWLNKNQEIPKMIWKLARRFRRRVLNRVRFVNGFLFLLQCAIVYAAVDESRWQRSISFCTKCVHSAQSSELKPPCLSNSTFYFERCAFLKFEFHKEINWHRNIYLFSNFSMYIFGGFFT